MIIARFTAFFVFLRSNGEPENTSAGLSLAHSSAEGEISYWEIGQ